MILWLLPEHDEGALIEAARQSGLTLQPLRQSCRDINLAPAFVLGYAALSRAQAKHAARQLARLLR